MSSLLGTEGGAKRRGVVGTMGRGQILVSFPYWSRMKVTLSLSGGGGGASEWRPGVR